GVLPPGFRFLSSKAQFFRPASHAPEDRLPLNRHSGDWNLIARLAPGVTLREAQAQMQVFNAQLAKDDPAAELLAKTGYHTRVESLHADHVKPVRRTLVLLQVGVMFLLLIGVANLANLLLIRASGQASEIAVRQALGAGRGSVIRRVGAEILALVVLAGIAGTLLGLGGLRLLTRLGANQLPLGEEIRFDARLALAAAGTMAVVGIVLATLVTVFHLRVRLAQGLRIISRGGTPGRATRRVHHGFVVTQVALAFVLLCGAGMLATSLRRVLRMPAGFEPSHILTGRIVYPWSGYTNQASRLAFVDRLVESVRVLPGVTQVAVTDSLPFSGGVDDHAIEVEGHAPTTGSSVVAHQLSMVSPDYWRAMGIPLLRGRLLEEADRHREPRACVVDQAFADRYWPGGDPLGHRLTVGAQFDPQDAVTIVGVVAAVKQADLTEPSGKGAVYQPYGRRWPESFTLVVRTAAAPEAMAPMVRQAVARCDPGMPWDDVRSMPSRIEASLVARRSPTVLAGVFAAVALFLSALGTYGVLAYAVGERRREIGVRMALGAQTGQVAAHFFGLGVKLCLMGLGLGVLGSVVAGRAMASVLYGMEGPPAGVIGAAGIALLLVMVLASLVPSRRAARLDPMEALRAD
ncbi:MAG: ABC transporter permease, partial [Verrucomicrobiales bacterium]|nr:ABC transporter permease [Verrucomicrobiales bacterium]